MFFRSKSPITFYCFGGIIWNVIYFNNTFVIMIMNYIEKRSISEDSLRRYVHFASESCIQELLSASEGDGGGWKVQGVENGVEISKRRSGSLHTFRSRWLLRSLPSHQFITVANAIDAAKVTLFLPLFSCLYTIYILIISLLDLHTNHLKLLSCVICLWVLKYISNAYKYKTYLLN